MRTLLGATLLVTSLVLSASYLSGDQRLPESAVSATSTSAVADEASQDCQQLAEPTFDSELQRGDCWREKGKSEQAVEAYQEALSRKKEGSRALFLALGLAYEDLGNVPASLDAFIAASRFPPPDAELLYHRGIAKEQLGDYQGAMSDFRAAVQLNPQHGRAHRNIGFILMQQDRSEDAVAELKEAIRIDPSDWKANLNLGSAYGNIYESLVKELQQIPAMNPPKPGETDPMAQRQLELIKQYHSFDYRQQALVAYREAARLKPDESLTWYALAAHAEEMQKHGEAIDAFRHAAELSPSDPKVFRGLANALGSAGQHKEAHDVAEKALALGGWDPWTLRYLATLEVQLGDYARAEGRYKEILQADPDEPYAHLGLARIYRRQQKTSESLKELKIAQRLRPDQSQKFESMLEHDEQ